MTPFFTKVRKQVTCALLLTAAFLAPAPEQAAIADTLDDAIDAAIAADQPPLFPRSVMARKRIIQHIRMAPDGAHIAYSIRRDRANALWLYDIDEDRHTHLFTSKMVDQIFWSPDSQHLFLESRQGVGVASLTPPHSPSFMINLDSDKDELFYRTDPTHPHAVIVSKQNPDGQGHVFYRVLPSGEKEQLFTSRAYVGDVLPAGGDGLMFVIRIKGTGLEVVRMQNGTETHLMDCAVDDRCRLVSYQAEADALIMQGTFGKDLTGLYHVDARTGSAKHLHSDPEATFDLRWVVLNAETGTPHAVGYKTDTTRFYGLGAKADSIIKRINTHLPRAYLALRANNNLSRWLVFDASTNLPVIRLYDAATDSFSNPFEALMAQPAFQDAQAITPYLAPRVPVWYTVSDGMHQQGYVTLPLGKDPATVPLVVVPHGGPWGQADGDYDTRAQFLANRGYAVFEPNFRASTGFGKHYTLSANRDFGDGRVQQDIIDGLEYVLSRGIGDQKKLAVFGHSFGGFSVLGALAFTPDLFQVGIAGAPPVDLSKAVKYFTNMDRSPAFKLRLENFKALTVDIDDPADVKRIRDKSPDAHWQNVTKPLYIWAGKKDPKVSVLNVRDYALRLADSGKAVAYLEEPRAGHSPRRAIERAAYFYMVEKGLSDHIGGRMDHTMSDELTRHLKRIAVIDNKQFLTPVLP